MRILGLDGFLRNRSRARLRNVMRGYRSLKRTGDLRRAAAVKEALTATPVFCPKENSEIFAGLSGKPSEIAVRQFLLVQLVSTGLGAALLSSIGRHNAPVVYPLPSAWRKILGEHGFPVAELRSALLWACVVVLHFANGILVALKLALAAFLHFLGSANRDPQRYVYFDALGPGNLPPAGGGGEKNDIVSWYLNWPGRAAALNTVCHNMLSGGMRESEGTVVVPIPSPHLPFADLALFVRFLSECFISIGRAFWGLMAGRWWYSMMLGETMKATHVRLQAPPLLAQDYLFHNSNWIYRPLWTYEAERKGSRIIFYFYSTNCEKFKHACTYPSLAYGWQAMTWPQYLVWDDYQEVFVRRAVGDAAEVTVVGPISFHEAAPVPLDLPARSIAVFDVQPMRDAVYQPLALDTEYYVPRNANSFLMDIQNAAASAERVMVFKRKRDVGTRVHPHYERTTRWLSGVVNCIEVDPDISAASLIKKCQAVISMPFTSTALLGREQGKPSVYYDPHGICEKDDRAAHGIPIVSGKAELKEWLLSLPS